MKQSNREGRYCYLHGPYVDFACPWCEMSDRLKKLEAEKKARDIIDGIRPAVTGLQPDPIPNTSTPVWELVIEDMKDRDLKGRRAYGTPLQAFNGRDPLWDAYEEILDTAVYLRQAIEEKRLQAK